MTIDSSWVSIIIMVLSQVIIAAGVIFSLKGEVKVSKQRIDQVEQNLKDHQTTFHKNEKERYDMENSGQNKEIQELKVLSTKIFERLDSLPREVTHDLELKIEEKLLNIKELWNEKFVSKSEFDRQFKELTEKFEARIAELEKKIK